MRPVRRLLTAARIEAQCLPHDATLGLHLAETQVQRAVAVVRELGMGRGEKQGRAQNRADQCESSFSASSSQRSRDRAKESP